RGHPPATPQPGALTATGRAHGPPRSASAEAIHQIVVAALGTVAVAVGAVGGVQVDLDGVGVDRGHAFAVVGDQAGEQHDHRHHEQLDADEGHRAPVDLAGGDRGDALVRDLVDVLF